MKRLLSSLILFEEGATAAEYAIMVSLVAIVYYNMFQFVAGKYPK